jgi:hypothetical protein
MGLLTNVTSVKKQSFISILILGSSSTNFGRILTDETELKTSEPDPVEPEPLEEPDLVEPEHLEEPDPVEPDPVEPDPVDPHPIELLLAPI